ncbi:MAG: hypothetical protein MKZ80_05930 [Candidatus Nitrosopelagicus sp.]|nr:hypothetical protein [Candidatus Nitrosopelagicus sp.]|tara:strand:+ start:1116 stop:1955 length:840 start_codon:yes stop_codon:yes gene_type:complete
MRIGSKSENEFFLKLNKINEKIQHDFLRLITSATKTVDTKVMLGDSTVKEVDTFDPKNVEVFFNNIINSLKDWESQGISYSYNDDVRRIFTKLEIREGDYVISIHVSLQFHVLLYYKPVQKVIDLQKELSEIIDKTRTSDSKYSDEGNKIILQKLQDLGYDKINEQNLFELFYNDESLSKILSEKIEGSQENEIIEFNNKKKELLNLLDDLLLETFQTSLVLIDEQRLVNGEEGCLCNIDLEHVENNSKQGLFDPDSLDDKSQENIETRINQISGALDA